MPVITTGGAEVKNSLPLDPLYPESFHGAVVQLREDAPVNGLDLFVAHVLHRLPLASDAAEMRVEPIVPRPRRIPVRDDIFLLVQIDGLATLWTEEDFGAHALARSPIRAAWSSRESPSSATRSAES